MNKIKRDEENESKWVVGSSEKNKNFNEGVDLKCFDIYFHTDFQGNPTKIRQSLKL